MIWELSFRWEELFYTIDTFCKILFIYFNLFYLFFVYSILFIFSWRWVVVLSFTRSFEIHSFYWHNILDVNGAFSFD